MAEVGIDQSKLPGVKEGKDWWLADLSILGGSLHIGDTPENLSDYLTACAQGAN